ncbi:MAG TPA: fatty acyl-AMP ligase [Solirubrobacterales bacterium]|nr:fatty acyl-AMP ligase [Solirubrobacterales bacterium]
MSEVGETSSAALRESFGAALARRAALQPEEPVFTYLEDDGKEGETLTFADLHRRAQAIAARLVEEVPAGGRALLLFPPGLDYVAAVYACFQAGVVGVSAPPPQPNRLHRTLPRLTAIAANAEIDAVLTAEFIRDAAKPLFEEGPLAEALWIATDSAPEAGEVEIARRPLTEMAFLQYTSGSTQAPRGVMLTHENLLDNSELITGTFDHFPNGIRKGLIWLPPYHDMGLIGGVLQPVHAGGLCILMSPLAVIKRPARWLEAMSRYRVTTSGGPNFAYDLCVRRVDEEICERLDLSDWEVAFNGAEPVRAETIRAFSEKFGRCGFRSSAFFTCYGLAEATLLVTGPDKDAEPILLEIDARALEDGVVRPPAGDGPRATLAGCGTPYEGSKLAIVGPEGEICEEGEVGEIWFAGPGVALGYWRQDEETEACFGAELASDPGTRYLRSGDLGTLIDGELFVVGRIKELIILNGRNIHPHDVEFSAEEAHPSLRSHCSAAFEQQVDGEARIGIVLEVNAAEHDGLDDVIAAVGRRVAEDLDLSPGWIGLCAPGSVPKTTSGKIQRRLSRTMLAEGEIELLAESRPG